ncbi:hypothetical protein BpHYR1_006821 [Brachionus plicatilis]|uniref:Uncharacterized protein n=1 Tax=Brachionus plicatilis TaxID=10195 RepID=A0A3M7SBF2_BRAPC|nr:hypothetical protein BpHYR1_006821 [Brachionus plicatilis]
MKKRLKGSTKQQGEEIGELIESQYLPEMPALFHKADREKKKRLQAMQQKRQSRWLQSRQVSIYSATTWCRDQYHRRKKSVAEEPKKKLVGRPPKQEISESPSGNKQRGPDDDSDEPVMDDATNIITKKTIRRKEVCEEDVDVEETIVTTHLQLLLTINLYPKIEIQSFLNRRLALCMYLS